MSVVDSDHRESPSPMISLPPQLIGGLLILRGRIPVRSDGQFSSRKLLRSELVGFDFVQPTPAGESPFIY
jgi:hypothetical protein